MKIAHVLSVAAFAALAVSGFAQTKATTAEIMKAAQAKAGKEGKVVFVHFTASWCGWCKKLEAFLGDKTAKPILDKAFVFVTLDVLENGDKKSLETPGGIELLTSLKAEQEGIPFTVIYDAKGKLLANSRRDDAKKGSNIGYPAAPEEIAHFMKMIDNAKKLTASDKATLKKWLEDNAPKG